jgi:hypothetical protein
MLKNGIEKKKAQPDSIKRKKNRRCNLKKKIRKRQKRGGGPNRVGQA